MTDIPLDREFWNDVLKRIARRTHRYSDAEDLLQTAFLRLERHRINHTVDNPAGFLVRTAINIMIDGDRHRKLLGNATSNELNECEDNSPLQDEVVAARARLARVKSGLEKLTPRTREVFLMHRLESVKYSDIASRLGISESAVEKHIAKAVLFLTEWTNGW